MPRSLAYFAAFTGMGALFIAMMLVAALVLGGRPADVSGAAPGRRGCSAW